MEVDWLVTQFFCFTFFLKLHKNKKLTFELNGNGFHIIKQNQSIKTHFSPKQVLKQVNFTNDKWRKLLIEIKGKVEVI